MLSQRRYRDIADPNFEPADPNFYDAQFYVHDRLGSVRLVVDYNDIDDYVSVANSYTYTPFGSFYDGQARPKQSTIPSSSLASGTMPRSTSTTSAPVCTTPP